MLVPASDVNQERISLAEAGLPSGGTITFQTLASTGITSSQFVQNVDYQEALEGQLASTIESIQGISSAQVSLVMPDHAAALPSRTTQTPTASVLVDLADGTELTSNQVQGIVHLVASAVPEPRGQQRHGRGQCRQRLCPPRASTPRRARQRRRPPPTTTSSPLP